ncbi:hypothetical protein K490DRAFT_57181 [Saccharata proteae CBS 121410]|uniref:Uncharacterized protein n=1 Tax=Saccharata proteae CBS 121410 TaxID=1314787 RepID=A0A9P4HXM5_9PEZI|nr:hypothetical protein K490DRAFT_57181 [Saccharata proteae CBS 121410]
MDFTPQSQTSGGQINDNDKVTDDVVQSNKKDDMGTVDEIEAQIPESITLPLGEHEPEASSGGQINSQSMNTGDIAASRPMEDPPQEATNDSGENTELRYIAAQALSDLGKGTDQKTTASNKNSGISKYKSIDTPAIPTPETTQRQQLSSDWPSPWTERTTFQFSPGINRDSGPERTNEQVISNASKPSQPKKKDQPSPAPEQSQAQDFTSEWANPWAERTIFQSPPGIESRDSEAKSTGDQVISDASKPSQFKTKDNQPGPVPEQKSQSTVSKREKNSKREKMTNKAKKAGGRAASGVRKSQKQTAASEKDRAASEHNFTDLSGRSTGHDQRLDDGDQVIPLDTAPIAPDEPKPQDCLVNEAAVKEMENEMNTYRGTIHFLSQQVDLDDDQIKTYEQAILRLTKRISRLEKTIARRRSGKRGIEAGANAESDDLSTSSGHGRKKAKLDPNHECHHSAGMMFYDDKNFGYIPKEDDDMRSYLKSLNHRISMRVHRENTAKKRAEKEDEIRRRPDPEEKKSKESKGTAAKKGAGRSTRARTRRGSPESVHADEDVGDIEQEVRANAEEPVAKKEDPLPEPDKPDKSDAEDSEVEEGEIVEKQGEELPTYRYKPKAKTQKQATQEPDHKTQDKPQEMTATQDSRASSPEAGGVVGIYRRPITSKGRPSQKMFNKVLNSRYKDGVIQYQVRHFPTMIKTPFTWIGLGEIINDAGLLMIDMFHVCHPDKPKPKQTPKREDASARDEKDNETDVAHYEDELERPIRSTGVGKSAATAKKPTGRITKRANIAEDESESEDSDFSSLSSVHSAYDDGTMIEGREAGKRATKGLNTSPEPRRSKRTTAGQGKAVSAAEKSKKTRSQNKSKKRPSPDPEEGPRKKGKIGR